VGSHAGFIPATSDEATAAAARAGAAVELSDVQRSRFHEIIERYYRAAPLVEHVVNHGDLALMNALWDGDVVALLDFEFALLGPAEIDLCRLVSDLVADDGMSVDPDAGAAAFDSLLASWIQSTAARCSTAPLCSTSSATSTSGSPAAGPTSGSKTGARTGCSLACSTRKAASSHPCSGDENPTVHRTYWRTNPSSRARHTHSEPAIARCADRPITAIPPSRDGILDVPGWGR